MNLLRHFWGRVKATVDCLGNKRRPRKSNLYDRSAVEEYCTLLDQIDRRVNGSSDQLLSEIDVYVSRTTHPTVRKTQLVKQK